ncbi:MAG: toxin ParE1/3/4 [Alphaproteobacteria bacterium]|jgi:toxin ParE1/3/4|nr:toxin ParE1/3/4 [Alphaproteobacteria bacterium]
MRKPRLKRTARAEQDLLDIWAYIAPHNLRAADRVLDILDEKSLSLARNPYAGMSRNDIAEGVRHLPVGNYLILYRALQDGIEVVRYVHGRRRLRDLV